MFLRFSVLSGITAWISLVLIGLMSTIQLAAKAKTVSQQRCIIKSLKATPAMLQAMIMPGIMGLENSKIWRKAKFMAALCSWLRLSPLLASSTIGAEKRAPPREGKRPRKAGITAKVNFALEKVRCSAATIPDKAPLVRSSISRHMTK